MALVDVPKPGQTLNDTQNPIRQNFLTTNTAFSVNHVDYNLADQGKHKFVTMPRQGAAPATVGTDVALYSKVGGVSAVSELAFRRQGNGTEVLFTEARQNQNGWTRLPSGIIMAWGRQTCNPNAVINFNAYQGVSFAAVYNAQALVETNGRHVSATIAGTTVTFVTDNNPTVIFFYVIGV